MYKDHLPSIIQISADKLEAYDTNAIFPKLTPEAVKKVRPFYSAASKVVNEVKQNQKHKNQFLTVDYNSSTIHMVHPVCTDAEKISLNSLDLPLSNTIKSSK